MDRAEISQLASDVQHFIRDGLPIGLIESAGYGKVDFAIPGLRQYLRG